MTLGGEWGEQGIQGTGVLAAGQLFTQLDPFSYKMDTITAPTS
jgi:hypothetical protein